MSRDEKSEFIAAVKKQKLTVSSLGFALAEDGPVFANENLTAQNLNILSAARAFKEKYGFQFVWVKDCAVKLRKSVGSRVYTIKTMADLDKVDTGVNV